LKARLRCLGRHCGLCIAGAVDKPNVRCCSTSSTSLHVLLHPCLYCGRTWHAWVECLSDVRLALAMCLHAASKDILSKGSALSRFAPPLTGRLCLQQPQVPCGFELLPSCVRSPPPPPRLFTGLHILYKAYVPCDCTCSVSLALSTVLALTGSVFACFFGSDDSRSSCRDTALG
jgi:hypothetical protein